jgi:hypothetical protein
MNPVRPIHRFRLNTLSLMLAGALALTACGGGGSSSDADTPPDVDPSTSITGVAAAGLPLIGTVTVRDANGVTRSDTLEAGDNGSYSIDVSGLTAPFVFRAVGHAGGREYVVHSAATEADVGGVINVTPLTDLVLSNIAGQVAASYFESSDYSGLTGEALDAEVDKLRERLLPVLQAMGVDSSIDLLRTPFTPLASALDKAIDVLRVDYDAGVATITNVVTNQQIQDALATKAAEEASAPTMDETDGIADSATDIEQIRKLFADFSAHFASGSPAVGTLKPYTSSDFLYRDLDADSLLTDLTLFPPLVGAKFTDVTIRKIDYTNASRPVAHVSFLMTGANGHQISFEKHWQVVKEGGKWLLHGDQRTLDVEIFPLMVNTTHVNKSTDASAVSSCKSSGFTLLIEDPDQSNSADVHHVVVQGPGLGDGVRLDRPGVEGSDRFRVSGDSNYYPLTSTCGTGALTDDAIAGLKSNAEYTVQMYDAQGQKIGSLTDLVPNRPLTEAELQASTEFPVIGGSLTFAGFTNFAGGTLNVSLSSLDPRGLGLVEGFIGYDNDDDSEAEDEQAVSATGTMTSQLQLPGAPAGARIWHRQLEVYNMAPSGREFATRWVVQGY